MDRFVAGTFFAAITALSLHSFAGGIQSRVFSLFLKTLNSQINGSLDAQSAEFIPPSSFIFENVKLKNKSGKEVFFAKSLKGTFGLTDLFSGALSFDEIQAISPKATLKIVKGHLDLLDVFTRPSQSGTSTVNFKRVNVSNAEINLATEDDFALDIKRLSFQTVAFDSRLKSIQFKTLRAAISSNSIPFLGEMTGALTLILNSAKLESRISFKGIFPKLTAFGIVLPQNSNFQTSLSFTNEKINFQNIEITHPKIKLEASGHYLLVPNNLSVNLKSTFSDSQEILPTLGRDLHLLNASIESKIHGPLESPMIEALAIAQWENIPFSGQVKVDTRTKVIAGDLALISKDKDLSLKSLLGVDLGINKLNAVTTISGTLDSPSAKGSIHFNHLSTDWMRLNKGDIIFSLEKNFLTVLKGNLHSAKGILKINSFGVNLRTKKMDGQVLVGSVDLFQSFPKVAAKPNALLNATIDIDGFLHDPKIIIDGKFQNPNLFGHSFGDFDVFAKYGHIKSHVFELSGALKGELGEIDLRSAIDTKSNNVNALAEIHHLKIDSITDALSPWVKVGPSTLRGSLRLNGQISNLTTDLTLRLEANEAAEDGEAAAIGARLDAQISQHQLDLSACATIDHKYQQDDPCKESDTFYFSGNGTVHSLDRWSMNYQGRLNGDRIESVSEILRREAVLLKIESDFKGAIAKIPNKHISHSVNATIQNLVADFPDIPLIKLKNPFVLYWSGETFSIRPKAVFSLTNGELAIEGSLNKKSVSASVEGKIPLLFSRLFSRNVVEASGLALGQVKLSGTLIRPAMYGSISPEKGSSIRLRWLPANIEFDSGEIKTTLLPDRDGHLQAQIDNLRFRIGNGEAFLKGNLEFNVMASREEDILKSTNLVFVGNDLSVALPDLVLEGDFNFQLQTLQNSHWLFGGVNISSGKITRNFSLDNFQFEALKRPGREFILPQFFSHFQTNINIDISSFDLDSNFVAFDFFGTTTGDLKVAGSLSSPRVHGVLELAASELEFPAATLEIPSTIIKLRNSADKAIDPEVHIKATAELSRQEFGVLSDDTTVELSLNGDFRNLSLDLRSVAGDRRLDRLEILLLLLNSNLSTGPSVSGDEVKSRTRESIQAATGPLLLRPITSELEKLLSSYTKTRFRIGSSVTGSGLTTSIQWRLNSRLELEGSTSISTSRPGLQDARFKLLLFDHLPFGRELFAEGIFLSPATQDEEARSTQTLRLTYRLFEQ